VTKAVLYARVSTEDQAGDDKTSLSEQLLALRRYAKSNGYEVVDEIPEDISGRKRNTPGLDQIRDMAEAGEIGAVLVHKWNRLARTVTRFEAFMAEMKMYRVDVVALDGQSNRTSQGRAMNRMMAVFSELQREDLIATMQQGKLGRARAGKVVPGRYAPYGFIYDPGIGNYRIDDGRMNTVRDIFRMVGAEGMTLYTVKKTLERKRIKPPEAVVFGTLTGYAASSRTTFTGPTATTNLSRSCRRKSPRP
jgi:DNA invertase Pin-like site-specific DNA recombinase